jgi:hypothetical protein
MSGKRRKKVLLRRRARRRGWTKVFYSWKKDVVGY